MHRSFRLAVLNCLVVAVAAVASAQAAAPNTLAPEEIAEGWLLLFDGETLFGWQPAPKADWKVVDGAIAASQGEQCLLLTTSRFGNYQLKVDFRAAKEGNSGVFLRTSADPLPVDVATKCYELNIADPDNPFPTGGLVKRKKADSGATTGEWQTFDVTADGGRFIVKLDGRQVLDYTDPSPIASGFIGLQFNRGKIEFRNVKLKPLGMKSLFNGKDLSGWKVHKDNVTKWTVTPEGTLHAANGKGQLETVGKYDDFTMQLDVLVNGKMLNSGVFFRSIPGEYQNGYEAQIQNGPLNLNSLNAEDARTGSIVRRQQARKVPANDKEWFAMTVHADGPHMAAWVNGCQVTDWTDTRKSDPNPRKGLRLEAGTIILQGHDPTTDLLFRNLRIAELPKR